jgi:hypothetical protein
MPRIIRAFALLVLLAAPSVYAQTTEDLPDLATVTAVTSDAETTPTTAATTAAATGDDEQTSTEDTDSTAATIATSDTDESTSAGTSATTTATFPDATTSTTTGGGFSLTDLPTIAGAGVPTLVIPYTAGAPFMQKSTMPEGTIFIAVGAVLAFMGACVLLWRGLVAWSINRSVKRAAMASIRGSEKNGSSTWKSGAGYGSGKNAYSKEYENGSSMSLDALTSTGKPIKPFKDDRDRQSSAPQQGLFFSPTAQATNRKGSAAFDNNRSSTYLPAGYYAAPAEGRTSNVGSSLAPYARHGAGNNPSPPHL